LGGGTNVAAQGDAQRVSCCLRDGTCVLLTDAQCDDFQADDVDVALTGQVDGEEPMCTEGQVCTGAAGIDSAAPTHTRSGAALVYVEACEDPEIDGRGYLVQRCHYYPVRGCQLIAAEPLRGSWPLDAWELGVDVPWAAGPSPGTLYVVVSGWGYFAGEEVSSCEGF